MGHHGVYYAPKIVPCACGSHEPYWHGPPEGQREYCCDTCWDRLNKTKLERTRNHEPNS